MSVCIYGHIHLRSHFRKTDINFKIEPVFECRYRHISVSEHGSSEKRKDTKQVVDGDRGHAHTHSHTTYAHTQTHMLTHTHTTVNKVACMV